MAWELYAEKNDVSFSPMTLSDESEILNAQFSVMTDRGLPSEPGGYVRVTIDNRTRVVLPFYTEDNGSSYYGEFDEQLNPSFVNYPLVAMSLPIAIQQEDCTIMIGAQDNYFAPESYEGNHTIKIEVGSDDSGDKPKRFKSIGVKEAMKHYVSTLENVTAATTIKGLTKQIMIATVGEDAGISEARTIAEIYEAAAIVNGYEPDEPTESSK